MTRISGVWAVVFAIASACASDPEQNQGPMMGAPSGASGASGPTGPSGLAGAAPSGQAGGGAMPLAGAGTGPAQPAAGSGSVDCAALPPPANMDDVVATFEDGTGATIQTAMRGGGFYMFNDMTGMQAPPPGMLPPAASVNRCGSTFALCMSGSNFMTWGAGMGTDFAPTTGGMGMGMKQTYDASAYRGVAFWAKSNTAPVSVRIGFKDKNTAPEGGVCDATATSGAEACNDDWGKAVTFGTAWEPHTVLFSELKQAGWGKAFTEFQIGAVYSIQFQVSQGVDFDLCIDDVAFVR